MSTRIVLALACLLLAAPVQGQTLPLVEDADWSALRTHALELVKQLETLKAPLPADTRKSLDALLSRKKPDDSADACLEVQKLLDAHCLLGVNINPESRVKVRRGPRRAELIHDQTTFVLVKVHNDGGVTHRLAADSPQKRTPKEKDEDRWLELSVVNDRPFADRLSGDKVEYRVLKLTARQSGKREATLALDVGQGTQDLGYRAEVPILFAVKSEKR
jgi:hypothetical protein